MTNLPLGNLADILAMNDVSEKVIDVPEWGCSVKIKGLTKAQQIALRKQAVFRGTVDEAKMEGLLFVYGVVEPKFAPEHIDRLFEHSSGPVDKVLLEIMRLSGMSDDADKEAEADFRE